MADENTFSTWNLILDEAKKKKKFKLHTRNSKCWKFYWCNDRNGKWTSIDVTKWVRVNIESREWITHQPLAIFFKTNLFTGWPFAACQPIRSKCRETKSLDKLLCRWLPLIGRHFFQFSSTHSLLIPRMQFCDSNRPIVIVVQLFCVCHFVRAHLF